MSSNLCAHLFFLKWIIVKNTMVHIDVCGIDVDFPFEPYECQKRYMEKVITCLQKVCSFFVSESLFHF